MIHFATVHFESDAWIDIQLEQIARFTNTDHRVWACLNGIEGYEGRFHAAYDLEGDHGSKLNALAKLIGEQSDADDLLIFIDGDAFPIDDYLTRLSPLLKTYPLIAVQRLENLGDVQPHPCFALTTVGFWNEVGGDWSKGGRGWITDSGARKRDVGSVLRDRLDDLGIEWHPLLRTNKRDLHPVMFGVYADLVYHHGAGFRTARTSADRHASGGFRWRRSAMPRFAKPLRHVFSIPAKRRLARRERINQSNSDSVYEAIKRDPDHIKRFFLDADAAPYAPI